MTSLAPHDPVQIAYAYARRMKMSREEARDCALDFRLHLLRDDKSRISEAAWVHRCAHNFVKNHLRALLRRQERERLYMEHNQVEASSLRVISAPGPRTLTLRKTLWKQVFATLDHFTPEQRDLFICYHIRQQSLTELAQRAGRTLPATSQALCHIHRRLARLLLAQGWSAEDARRLCSSSALPSSPRAHPSPV